MSHDLRRRIRLLELDAVAEKDTQKRWALMIQMMQLKANLGHNKCILCGKPASLIGMWMPGPDQNKAMNAPEGKTRVATYFVCDVHHADGKDERNLTNIEKTIMLDAIEHESMVILNIRLKDKLGDSH